MGVMQSEAILFLREMRVKQVKQVKQIFLWKDDAGEASKAIFSLEGGSEPKSVFVASHA